MEPAEVVTKRYLPRIQEEDGVRIAYKVVTKKLQSLGLRNNPNILTYPIKEWYELPDNWIEAGRGDWGGIWLSRLPSTAFRLAAYCKEHHGMKCRVFKSEIGEVLFVNSYRLKTDKVLMKEELRKPKKRNKKN